MVRYVEVAAFATTSRGSRNSASLTNQPASGAGLTADEGMEMEERSLAQGGESRMDE